MNKEEEVLKDRDVRPTAMRILVLRYLLEQKTATSLKALEEHFYQADKSTLFRTLKKFEEQKVIHAIDDGSRMTKYALCLESCACEPQDQHFHFHCNSCQETYCLTDQNIPSIQLPAKFKMQQANLVLKGVCANCS